jgi:hypothetical protein
VLITLSEEVKSAENVETKYSQVFTWGIYAGFLYVGRIGGRSELILRICICLVRYNRNAEAGRHRQVQPAGSRTDVLPTLYQVPYPLPPRYRIRIHDFYIQNPGSYSLGSVNLFSFSNTVSGYRTNSFVQYCGSLSRRIGIIF